MWTATFQYSATSAPVALHVFGTRTASTRLPVVLYFHGGLFNCGTVEDAYATATVLSEQVLVICVDYPLAPAMHFPDTIEVAFEALGWIIKNARLIGADTKRIFVAGEQAGGNLAAVVAMLFRDRAGHFKNHVRLGGQILINPMLDALQTSKSMGAVTDSPCRRAWAAYIPVASDCLHPYASPLHSCRLAGLAPALVITSGMHPLRDEAEAYAAKLLLAGVPVQVQRLEDGENSLACPQHACFKTLCRLIRHFVAE